MKSHKSIQKKFYEYLRGEMTANERRDVETHLATCDRCSSELAAFRTMIDAVDANLTRPSEQRGELYWQQFAERVERRIEDETEENTLPSIVRQLLDGFVLHRKPFGIGFASALTLVMIVFGVWSLWIRNPATEQAARQLAEPGEVRMQNAALESRAQDYLEQSKVLLIGLMNTDVQSMAASGMTLEREQEISRRLVSESGDLTAKLNDPSQRRLKELISDLQLILVQIANLSAGHDIQGLEVIKGGIEHNDMLFKINLEQIQRTTKSPAFHGKTAKRTT